MAEPEHLNTGADPDEIGGDLRSDAQTGQTQLASLTPCVRKGREFIEDVLGRD